MIETTGRRLSKAFDLRPMLLGGTKHKESDESRKAPKAEAQEEEKVQEKEEQEKDQEEEDQEEEVGGDELEKEGSNRMEAQQARLQSIFLLRRMGLMDGLEDEEDSDSDDESDYIAAEVMEPTVEKNLQLFSRGRPLLRRSSSSQSNASNGSQNSRQRVDVSKSRSRSRSKNNRSGKLNTSQSLLDDTGLDGSNRRRTRSRSGRLNSTNLQLQKTESLLDDFVPGKANGRKRSKSRSKSTRNRFNRLSNSASLLDDVDFDGFKRRSSKSRKKKRSKSLCLLDDLDSTEECKARENNLIFWDDTTISTTSSGITNNCRVNPCMIYGENGDMGEGRQDSNRCLFRSNSLCDMRGDVEAPGEAGGQATRTSLCRKSLMQRSMLSKRSLLQRVVSQKKTQDAKHKVTADGPKGSSSHGKRGSLLKHIGSLSKALPQRSCSDRNLIRSMSDRLLIKSKLEDRVPTAPTGMTDTFQRKSMLEYCNQNSNQQRLSVHCSGDEEYSPRSIVTRSAHAKLQSPAKQPGGTRSKVGDNWDEGSAHLKLPKGNLDGIRRSNTVGTGLVSTSMLTPTDQSLRKGSANATFNSRTRLSWRRGSRQKEVSNSMGQGLRRSNTVGGCADDASMMAQVGQGIRQRGSLNAAFSSKTESNAAPRERKNFKRNSQKQALTALGIGAQRSYMAEGRMEDASMLGQADLVLRRGSLNSAASGRTESGGVSRERKCSKRSSHKHPPPPPPPCQGLQRSHTIGGGVSDFTTMAYVGSEPVWDSRNAKFNKPTAKAEIGRCSQRLTRSVFCRNMHTDKSYGSAENLASFANTIPQRVRRCMSGESLEKWQGGLRPRPVGVKSREELSCVEASLRMLEADLSSGRFNRDAALRKVQASLQEIEASRSSNLVNPLKSPAMKRAKSHDGHNGLNTLSMVGQADSDDQSHIVGARMGRVKAHNSISNEPTDLLARRNKNSNSAGMKRVVSGTSLHSRRGSSRSKLDGEQRSSHRRSSKKKIESALNQESVPVRRVKSAQDALVELGNSQRTDSNSNYSCGVESVPALSMIRAGSNPDGAKSLPTRSLSSKLRRRSTSDLVPDDEDRELQTSGHSRTSSRPARRSFLKLLSGNEEPAIQTPGNSRSRHIRSLRDTPQNDLAVARQNQKCIKSKHRRSSSSKLPPDGVETDEKRQKPNKPQRQRSSSMSHFDGDDESAEERQKRSKSKSRKSTNHRASDEEGPKRSSHKRRSTKKERTKRTGPEKSVDGSVQCEKEKEISLEELVSPARLKTKLDSRSRWSTLASDSSGTKLAFDTFAKASNHSASSWGDSGNLSVSGDSFCSDADFSIPTVISAKHQDGSMKTSRPSVQCIKRQAAASALKGESFRPNEAAGTEPSLKAQRLLQLQKTWKAATSQLVETGGSVAFAG